MSAGEEPSAEMCREGEVTASEPVFYKTADELFAILAAGKTAMDGSTIAESRSIIHMFTMTREEAHRLCPELFPK